MQSTNSEYGTPCLATFSFLSSKLLLKSSILLTFLFCVHCVCVDVGVDVGVGVGVGGCK